MINSQVPREFIEKIYTKRKARHPHNCYGLWTWISGSLKVKCQGCGYTMVINPATCELKHLDSADEAVENTLDIRNYGRS